MMAARRVQVGAGGYGLGVVEQTPSSRGPAATASELSLTTKVGGGAAGAACAADMTIASANHSPAPLASASPSARPIERERATLVECNIGCSPICQLTRPGCTTFLLANVALCCQNAESSRQKAEVRRREAGGWKQETGGGSQKSEVGSQKAGSRRRRAFGRGQFGRVEGQKIGCASGR